MKRRSHPRRRSAADTPEPNAVKSVVVVKHAAELRVHLYRQALLEEAKRLVKAGVLHEQEDAYYLTFHEFHDAVRTNRADDKLIHQRTAAFEWSADPCTRNERTRGTPVLAVQARSRDCLPYRARPNAEEKRIDGRLHDSRARWRLPQFSIRAIAIVRDPVREHDLGRIVSRGKHAKKSRANCNHIGIVALIGSSTVGRRVNGWSIREKNVLSVSY